MESLSSLDIQNLLQGIAQLNTLRDLDLFGAQALDVITQLIKSEVPCFRIVDTQTFHYTGTPFPGYPAAPHEFSQASRQHILEHPLVRHMPLTQRSVHKISDFTTLSELHRLEAVYHQNLRVIDCEDQMALFLPNEQLQHCLELRQNKPNNWVIFVLHRHHPTFTERDRLIFNLLKPHLVHAYNNVQHFARLQHNLTKLHQNMDRLGLVILTSSGQVQYIAPSAVQFLQSYFDCPINSSHLPDSLWAWVRHQIATNTQPSEPPNARLPLRIENNGKQLVIRIVNAPDSNCYLLLLEEQILSLKQALELLDLRPREKEVLYWVIKGKDNQTISTYLNVHVSTIRKHLESIFRRFGVSSRTEAIAYALEQLGILH
jgi:DNA-binding CsgD family transcriptional regulator